MMKLQFVGRLWSGHARWLVLIALFPAVPLMGAENPCVRQLGAMLEPLPVVSQRVLDRHGFVARARSLAHAYELSPVAANRTALIDHLKVFSDFLQDGDEIEAARGVFILNQVMLDEHVVSRCSLPRGLTRQALAAQNVALVERYGAVWGVHAGETLVPMGGVTPVYQLGLVRELRIDGEQAVGRFLANEGEAGARALNGLPFLRHITYTGLASRAFRPEADFFFRGYFQRSEVAITFPTQFQRRVLPRDFSFAYDQQGTGVELAASYLGDINVPLPDLFFTLENSEGRIIAVYRTGVAGRILVARPAGARPADRFRLRCLGGASAVP